MVSIEREVEPYHLVISTVISVRLWRSRAQRAEAGRAREKVMKVTTVLGHARTD